MKIMLLALVLMTQFVSATLTRQSTHLRRVSGPSIRYVLRYTGTYGTQSETWIVKITSDDLPDGQKENPTNAQVNAAADAKAIAIYNNWLKALSDYVENGGQEAIVVP